MERRAFAEGGRNLKPAALGLKPAGDGSTMGRETTTMQNNAADAEPAIHAIHVAPSPHLSERAFTTRRMMVDVLIGLAPLLIVAVWVFRWHAGTQIAICVVSCLAAEGIFTAVRR